MSDIIYTIRQLTKELGVTARALRYYEDKKLVSPRRRGTTRLYTFEDYGRIRIVLRGRRLGFTLEEMREVLRMYDYKDGDAPDQLRMARSRFLDRIAKLMRKQSDIEESVQHLTECVFQIEDALEGKSRSRTPWHEFFRREPARSERVTERRSLS